MTKNVHTHSIVARLALLTAAPRRRADHPCDDIANQLKTHIDGLKVGMTAANTIYLSHPLTIELSLGCSGRNFKNELYGQGRQPEAETSFPRSRRQRCRYYFHLAERQYPDWRHARHRADGVTARQHRQDALSPP